MNLERLRPGDGGERQCVQSGNAVGARWSAGPRNSQISSTRPAATNDDATRAPPSTISFVMPFSDNACSTADRSNPGGVVVAATRIALCAGRAEFHRGGRFSQIRRSSPRVAFRARNSPAGCCRAIAAPGPARPAPASALPCPAAGRSRADHPPAPCRCRPGWRRFARADICTRVRAASPVIATGLRPATPILSSADTASLSSTCGR